MSDIKPGRPRSASAEHAIVAATLAELEAVGYPGLTIEAVARRAGVGRPTIYRRWADRDALVVGALIATAPPLVAPSTGDPAADLRALVADFISAIAASPASRAVLAVHAAGIQRPELRQALHEHYLAPRAEVLADSIDQARSAGVIRRDVTDDQARDLLFGPAVYRWLIVGEVPPPDEVDRLLDVTFAALRARRTSNRGRSGNLE